MHRYKIELVTGQDINEFVQLAELQPFPIKIQDEKGEKFGDAKTLLNVIDSLSWGSVYMVTDTDVYSTFAKFIV